MVDGHTVQQHEILIRRAAPDEETRRTLIGPADPGQQLERAEDVHFAHAGQHRHVPR